jgi:PhzF family phenazine biosynthesis protein
MRYYHVDVFSDAALGGNGLTVVFPDAVTDGSAFLEIAREFKQFETSFIYPLRDGAFPVRIFTVDEELPFAGHPLLGSAAVLHRVHYPDATSARIVVSLGCRKVTLESVVRGHSGYSVTMNQGVPEFLADIDRSSARDIAQSLSLASDDIDPGYPLEVVSTGLSYLLVPLRSGLDRARIARPDFESFLSGFGAKFAYLFDTGTLECRTWDNGGRVEDSATGSAAGPLSAYLVKNGKAREGEAIELSQGRFTGRPAKIECRVKDGSVFVRGDVTFFAEGEILS